MANRNMALDVIVRLKDLLSGPLRGLRGALDGVAGMARKIGLVGTAVAGISFLGPMQEAAAFQQQLLDIAGTSALTGRAAFDYVEQAKAQFEGLALQYGQFSETIAQGAGKMIASGLDEGLVSGSMASIAKATKAANASFDDMSGVAISLLQTLKLPAGQLDETFAGLIVAGKMGSFELKDMARFFPNLTGQMVKLGISGRDAANQLAAMLEIARKGTADPAEAANNLQNFLAKITSPETKKNFEKMKVDILGVMKDAATQGISPIEAVIQKITTLTGISGKEIAGLMSKAKANGMTEAEALEDVRKKLEAIHGAGALGGLFGDMQVMNFLIPMLANIDEYKRIKEEVAKATGAMADADFETQMQGLNTQLTIFKEIGTQASREVGLAFGTWMPAINGYLSDAIRWLRDLDKSTGGMVRQTLAWAGVAVLAAAGLGILGLVLPVVGAGLSLVLGLLSPVGIALAAVAAGAVWLWQNWSSVAPRLGDLWRRAGDAWTGMKEKASSFMPAIRSAGTVLRDFGALAAGIFGPRIARGFEAAYRDIATGWQRLKGLFSGFIEGLDLRIDMSGWSIDDSYADGFRAIASALDAVATAWNAVRSFGAGFSVWLEPLGEAAGRAVSSVVDIASGLLRLLRALGGLVAMSDGKASSLFRMLGDLAGGSITAAVDLVGKLAGAVASLVNALADLAEGTFDWSWLKMPDSIAGAWQAAANAIQAVKDALGVTDQRNKTRFGRNSMLPANQNGAPAVLPAESGTPVPQQINVQTQATVKVEGPGQVVGQQTAVTSSSPNVNTGRAVGRP